MPPGNTPSSNPPPSAGGGSAPAAAPGTPSRTAAFRPAEGPIRLPVGQRYLGLDLGTKTIGLALSDAGHRIASPYATIQRRKFKDDAAELVRIAGKEGVAALVLGLPVNMDGSEGPRCQAARAFARNIAQHLPMPIALWDERMSTMAVQRMMTDEADLSRARRAELVDKLAASYILQAYLDWLAAQTDTR